MHPAFAQADSALAGKVVHLYLPSDEVDSMILRNWSLPTRKTGKYWHSVTLPPTADKYTSNQGFFFADKNNRYFIAKEGFGYIERTRFHVADFQGRNEMWIIIDPAGPLTAPPTLLPEPPKIINVLNPWEATGPRLAFSGGTSKGMMVRPDRCGWFMAFLLKPAEMSLHLQEINGTGSYGTGGLGTTTYHDMSAQFTAKGVADTLGMELWLDTQNNAWLPTYPAKDGNCRFLMATTVRDFSREHPDFDFGAISGDFTAPGMVENTIGADRRPVRSSASPMVRGLSLFNDFGSWWATDSTHATPGLRSYETCVDIPLSKTGDGLWEYDSWKTPERGFYPIDDFNRHAETIGTCAVSPDGIQYSQTGFHNLNFCMETHATFTYRKGQRFEFRGDDDFWVFINDKLVIDLGGLHTPLADTVNLDTLGLTEGREYRWDMFLCDRQPCTSSLRFKTSIYFKQRKALEAIEDSTRRGTYRIVRREGGAGSCAGLGDTSKAVPATDLTFQLWDAAGQVVTTLANGTHFNGSLVIAAAPPNLEAKVTVDTSIAPAGLAPGHYRIVAFEAANASLVIEIPFRVGTGPTALQSKAKVRPRTKKPISLDALGRERPGTEVRKVFRKP